MLIATLVFWEYYDRYESAGPALLASPSLSDATRIRGNCAETNNHFVLTVPVAGKLASLNFRMPEAGGYEMIRVSGRIKVDGVVPGKHVWNSARLLLTQYDSNDSWIPGHHTLKSEKGTKDWQVHENVFDIQSEAVNVDVVIQHIGVAGIAEFDQLMAEPVRYKLSFHVWRVLFFGLWIYLAFTFYRNCRLDRRKFRILILLNVLVILWGTMMPGKWIETISQDLKAGISRIFSAPPDSDVHHDGGGAAQEKDHDTSRIDVFNEMIKVSHRLGHFLLFASLCFLVYLSAALERQHPIYFLKVALDLLLFATIMESLQYLTLDRTPGINDWLTDVYGMATAFVVFLTVLAINAFISILKRAKYV
ncbi:MAG: VanZ family protein [Pontiella sp.]